MSVFAFACSDCGGAQWHGSSEKLTCQVLVIDTLAKLSHDADQENS